MRVGGGEMVGPQCGHTDVTRPLRSPNNGFRRAGLPRQPPRNGADVVCVHRRTGAPGHHARARKHRGALCCVAFLVAAQNNSSPNTYLGRHGGAWGCGARSKPPVITARTRHTHGWERCTARGGCAVTPSRSPNQTSAQENTKILAQGAATAGRVLHTARSTCTSAAGNGCVCGSVKGSAAVFFFDLEGTNGRRFCVAPCVCVCVCTEQGGRVWVQTAAPADHGGVCVRRVRVRPADDVW